MWQNYINAFLGFCMLVVAITTAGTIDATLAWTFGTIGALTLVLGLWGGIADSSFESSYGREHKHA